MTNKYTMRECNQNGKIYHFKSIRTAMIKRKENNKDFPGGPVAEAPGSQCRGPRFHPRSGNPHATTKSLQAVTKDATCRNKD